MASSSKLKFIYSNFQNKKNLKLASYPVFFLELGKKKGLAESKK